MTTKQFEQSREHLQVVWLLFSLNENTQKLARNYKMLSFEVCLERNRRLRMLEQARFCEA